LDFGKADVRNAVLMVLIVSKGSCVRSDEVEIRRELSTVTGRSA